MIQVLLSLGHPQIDLTSLYTFLWCLWKARNEQEALTAYHVSNAIMQGSKLEDRSPHNDHYRNRVVRSPQLHQSGTMFQLPSIWEKPKEDFMKVNFDGAFHEATGTGGWGFIIRNHRGEFVAAGAGRLSHLRDPLHAETLACIAAVKGAAVLGARKVIFESDCSNLGSEELDRSALWPSTMEARKICAAAFQNFSFSFCRRACNSAAHELAKVGVKSAASTFIGWTLPPVV
jgi:ribonuclease HI